MMNNHILLVAISGYLLLLLAVGLVGRLGSTSGRSDFLLAARDVGPFFLLMTLFGTNMTAFSLLGASEQAYREGIGVYAMLGTSSAIVIPLVYFFVGTRVWAQGVRHRFVTQTGFLRERYGSDSVAWVVLCASTVFLIPYIVIGVKGGGAALAALSDGALPTGLGSAILCIVILLYVCAGGMRATTWVNTFQSITFIFLGIIVCVSVVQAQGGFDSIFRALEEKQADLLVMDPPLIPTRLLSFGILPVSVAAFPHIFNHWLTARNSSSFRLAISAYPICIALVWFPSVLLGLTARATFSVDPVGPVLIELASVAGSAAIGACLAVAILAAIMSSLDSQVLALSSMVSNDLLCRRRNRSGRSKSEMDDTDVDRLGVGITRITVAVVIGISLCIALISTSDIFVLGTWSLTGFAGLVPTIVAALYMRSSTPTGIIASTASTLVLWCGFLIHSGNQPDYSLLGSGLLPVVVIQPVAWLVLFTVSAKTRPVSRERLERFLPSRPRIEHGTNHRLKGMIEVQPQ